MFRVLLAKEFREQWRTWRLLILVAVLTISGLISPLLAKYTPALLRSIPDMPPGLAEMIPEPTTADSILQYVKNISQFGLLLAVILIMGTMAQEKERGTAAMLLTRPVRRSSVVISKWVVWMLSIAAGVVLSGLACWFYTAILFDMLPLGEFTLLNLLIWLFLAVYASMALFASTLARTQSVAAGVAFGGLAVLLVLSSLPRVNEYMPSQLLAWGSEIISNGHATYWPALAISAAIILAFLVVACLRFEREEI